MTMKHIPENTLLADRLVEAGAAKKPKTRNRAGGDITALRKLVDACGGDLTKAAGLIGFTASGLHTVMQRERASKTAEVAARGALAEMGKGTEPRDQLLMIRVPESKAENVRTVLGALSVRIFDVGRAIE